ncbi:MAG: glycosyltransferase [Polyangiaceae bacterium]
MGSSARLHSIVIPVYRSEACLATTVRELLAFFETRWPVEIILVNDGSPDGVQRVVDELCAADTRVRGVTLGKNVGQHRATLQGFRESRGDVVVTLDDDGQNPPEAALSVAETLRREDFDVVYGKFDVIEQSAARRVASLVNRWVSRRTLPNERDIAISNVRALRGDLARQLGAFGPSYPYVEAMIFRMTNRIGEANVPHRRREAGVSGYGLGTLVTLSLSHLTSLSTLPLRVAIVGSFSIAALGFVGGVVAVLRAMLLGGAPVGWLSLFCAITFLFSLLFAFLGIVSTYLGRLYVSANARGLVWVRTRSPAPESGDTGG